MFPQQVALLKTSGMSRTSELHNHQVSFLQRTSKQTFGAETG